MEVEMEGMHVQGDKVSDIPEEHDGLESGEYLGDDFWNLLIDTEGAPFVFSKLHRESVDVVVVYADPRRMTDQFKTILNEFNKVPQSNLNIAIAAINCDDQVSAMSWPLLVLTFLMSLPIDL